MGVEMEMGVDVEVHRVSLLTTSLAVPRGALNMLTHMLHVLTMLQSAWNVFSEVAGAKS